MIKVCTTCAAEYDRDANYCNVCRTESLISVEPVPPPRPLKRPLRDDAVAASVAGISWILGLGYLLGELTPRDFTTVVLGWATLSAVTVVVGMIMSNLRVFAVFSGLGFLCCVIYGLVRLT